MSRKIKCPNPLHTERTDSCHVYSTHLHCFGCGYRASVSGHEGLTPSEDPEPEDLSDAFGYIDGLPHERIRGLLLPADASGFFIRWPDRTYYKRRYWDREPKYVGAKGHAKPLFWASRNLGPLILCEGELNALSLAEAFSCSVASPGGVGDFTSRRLEKHYAQISVYADILLVVDNDAPGAIAAIEALGFLRARGHKVNYLLMDPDANEILASQGKDALKDHIEGRLGRHLEESPI